MSFHRVTLVAFAALFMAGPTSVAFAGCCGWGPPPPVAYYPPPAVYAGPCGGCAAPITCGGCGPPIPAPITYAPPVAPMPIAAPPVMATPLAAAAWGMPVAYAAPVIVLPPPIVPAPIYVVDQGPAYTGPGVMVLYRTWSPGEAYAPAIGFPYVAHPAYGYRYGPRRRHYAYLRPHHYYRARHWRRYPLHVRD